MKKNILKGGKADNMSLEDIAKKHNVSIDFIKKQLKAGMKVEMEHTNDPKKTEEIAMDHLFEDAQYYIKLKKVEAKESTGAASSGSFEGPAFSGDVIKRNVTAIHNSKSGSEINEVIDASSSGSYDVSFSSGEKGRNPLSIGGKKTIDKRRKTIRNKNFPLWGGPKSKFVKIKEKCKKYPYCNQGPEAIELTSESNGKKQIFMIMKKDILSSIIDESLANEVKKRILFEQYEKTIDFRPFTLLSNKIKCEPYFDETGKKSIIDIDPMDDMELKDVIKKLHNNFPHPMDIDIDGDKIIAIRSDEFGGDEEINENLKRTRKMKKHKDLNEEPCIECNQNMEEDYDEASDLRAFGDTLDIDEDICPKCGKKICECGKNPVQEKEESKKVLKLNETELVNMIERIVLESVPGKEKLRLTKSGGKKEEDQYLNDVDKKIKKYLSFDGNDNPEFPKPIGKGEKVAYRNTPEDDEYVDENRGRGPQDLKYDTEPSKKFKERLKKAIEDGDNPGKDVVSVTKSEAGKKTYKNIEKRAKARKNEPMYKKDPQPVKKVNEEVNEEIDKMKRLAGYDKKTQ